MLADHMELIFAAFPDVLQYYVELRGGDWKPEGVTWTYETSTGVERVRFTMTKGGQLGYLEQVRQSAVTKDGSPVGEPTYGEVSFQKM